MKNSILKSSYGSVKPYTRHTGKCPHKTLAHHNSCPCPKWLYENQKGTEPVRRSLSTPSWAEAQRIASDVLRGFDPEIAAARAAAVKTETARLSIKDACGLWLARTERELGRDGTYLQYQSLMNKFERWAQANGVAAIQDLTTIQLERWYSSKDWTDYAQATRAGRWGVLRSMFAYLLERAAIKSNPMAAIKAVALDEDLVQGPYTDEQVKRIFAELKGVTIPPGMSDEDAAIYPQRLEAFAALLLYTGCDIIDACLFEPERLVDTVVDGALVSVYRYKRRKTGVQAVIPISAELATTLRTVPLMPDSPPGMPFRTHGTKLRSDVWTWSRRIDLRVKAAGVEWVYLPGKDSSGQPRKHKANVKQFRHTFAVQQLVAGQRPEEVARMLGHTDTTMIRKHYAPWVQELDTAHVRMVMDRRVANLPNRGLTVALSAAGAPAAPLTLVSAS